VGVRGSAHGSGNLRVLRDLWLIRHSVPEMFRFLQTRRDGPVEYLTLNRPDVRNAFNEDMIAELAAWARGAATDTELRAVVIAGAGPVFCAGADLAWMAKMAGYSREENVRDAAAAAEMYGLLDTLLVPLIGRIHGAAFGGGAGLAAVCDVVVADEAAIFGFTEVKLGIVPAMISPFVVGKIGRSAARELLLTGRRFSAARAREIGLVHAVVPMADLDAGVAEYLADVLAAAPQAVGVIKALLRQIADRPATSVRAITAATLASRRASAEGQAGLRAFLDKRRAPWHREQTPRKSEDEG
jgi:methylglutaconyl-CoA hydratase